MKFLQTESFEYAPRTWHNATNADMTAAFAIDFRTLGERLTKKAALHKNGAYVDLHLACTIEQNAELLLSRCIENKTVILNVAGNSMHTLCKCKPFSTQRKVNLHIYEVLRRVHKKHKIATILSGGQTGVDWAGIVAAAKLKIPFEATFPRHFKQRNNHGKEFKNTEKELERLLNYHVQFL